MSNTLVIREKYSKYWPQIAIINLLLALLLFVSYQFIDDVLLVGYLRLGAFIFFAAGLLSLFKVKDGQVEIIVELEDDSVESTYKVRGETIFATSHPTSDLHELKIDQLPDKSIYNNFVKNDKCVRFRRKDESNWFFFNEMESRVIPLNEENAKRLYSFLKETTPG